MGDTYKKQPQCGCIKFGAGLSENNAVLREVVANRGVVVRSWTDYAKIYPSTKDIPEDEHAYAVPFI